MDYEQMYVLFEALNLKNNSHLYWSDNSGWGMAKAIECVVLNKIDEIIKKKISLSYDEVTSIDCQSRINVHRYIVRDWKPISLILTLERDC